MSAESCTPKESTEAESQREREQQLQQEYADYEAIREPASSKKAE